MIRILANPALWASLAALLAALGVELPSGLVDHALELVAALAGIVGIIMASMRRTE